MPASQAVHMESPADTIEELAPDRNRPKIRYQHYTFRNATTSFTAGEFSRQLAGHKVRTDIVEGTTGASGEAIAPKQESDCDDVYYPQVILNERSSPLLSAAATGVDARAVGDGDFSRTPPAPLESQLHARHGHSRKLVWSDGEQDPEAGPSHVSGDSRAVPAAPESKGARKDDSTVVEPDVIELVDTNDEDICEEEQASMSTGCDDRSDDESDGQDPSSERERLEIELLQADLRIEVLKRKLIERKLQSPVLKKSRASQVDHSTHVDE
ncbi:hypothetical protein V5799_000365 [Amblyomma americanum]|uniref:Uncharacterized protein n=1 Tax=Amblyomma americanum TaxID=6943 RepID=A0AAQ4D394_AMBAM